MTVINAKKIPLLNTALSCQSCNKTQAEPDRTEIKVEEKQCKTALNPMLKSLFITAFYPLLKLTT